MSEAGTPGAEPQLAVPDLRALTERVTALGAEAKARLDLLLDRYDHRFNKHERQISASLREKLAKLDSTLSDVCLALARAKAPPTDPIYRRLFAPARSVTLELRDIHDMLRHLSVPEVASESIVFVNFAWRKLLEEPLGEGSRGALVHAPALCLSSDIVPSAHPYDDISVVSLAKLDYGNPLAWPAMVHELGHGALRDLEFSVADAQNKAIQSRWLLEMGCDLVGLRLCGPAYLATFLLQSLTEKAFFGATTRHPAPVQRAHFLIGNCPEWLRATELFRELNDLIVSRSFIESDIAKRAATALHGTRIICQECDNTWTIKDGMAEAFPSERDRFLSEFNEKLPLRGYSEQRFAAAERLVPFLREGTMIASSRDRNKSLEALRALVAQAAVDEVDAEAISQALGAAKRAACDEPNDSFDIVTAGWLHYLKDSKERLAATLLSISERSQFSKRWTDFIGRIDKQDELLRTSIEAADFHEQFKGVSAFGQ